MHSFKPSTGLNSQSHIRWQACTVPVDKFGFWSYPCRILLAWQLFHSVYGFLCHLSHMHSDTALFGSCLNIFQPRSSWNRARDGSPVHLWARRWSGGHTHTRDGHTHTKGQFRVFNWPNSRAFLLWEEIKVFWENIQTPWRNSPGWNSSPGPSCCHCAAQMFTALKIQINSVLESIKANQQYIFVKPSCASQDSPDWNLLLCHFITSWQNLITCPPWHPNRVLLWALSKPRITIQPQNTQNHSSYVSEWCTFGEERLFE